MASEYRPTLGPEPSIRSYHMIRPIVLKWTAELISGACLSLSSEVRGPADERLFHRLIWQQFVNFPGRVD